MNTIKISFIALALILGLASFASAQTVLSNTTLNGAVTATQTFVILTASTASAGATVGAPAAGQQLWVDYELMLIRSMTGTRADVVRGVGGIVGPHATSAVVFTGPPAAFHPGPPPLKTCTTATMGTRPWIVTQVSAGGAFGDIGLCKASVWTFTNVKPITYNSVDPY
jgi:hypothetical protein